ncbi:Uncharacterized protein APZ42_005339 [Daphnia magna]|uniref:Uncharacterized protein n=1 Tax=Daphnia magna TaxID=35525 RepID=A0A164GI54_9CRUS|nr:Uncharacterized protein APZ42_005339 [Daphnia magna]
MLFWSAKSNTKFNRLTFRLISLIGSSFPSWIGYYRIIYVGNLLNNHENLGVTTTTNSYCDTIQIFRVWEPQIWFAENLGRLTMK